MFEKCRVCDRTLVSDKNLKLLRKIIMGSSLGGGILGYYALPLIGFDGGVTANSLAASWHASIGNVAAGTLFANLQSLGATGLGSIMFGTLGAATPTAIALTRLNWCNEHRDYVYTARFKPKL